MKKYSRRLINQKAQVHDKDFVLYDDVQELLIQVMSKAIEAGADEGKLMGMFSDE